jgi:hypothetical protein
MIVVAMTDGSGGDEPPGHVDPRGAPGTASASGSPVGRGCEGVDDPVAHASSISSRVLQGSSFELF